jgi:hypothetical protein
VSGRRRYLALLYRSRQAGTVALVTDWDACPQEAIDLLRIPEGSVTQDRVARVIALLADVDTLFAPIDYRNVGELFTSDVVDLRTGAGWDC